jgi:hypothetical protein
MFIKDGAGQNLGRVTDPCTWNCMLDQVEKRDCRFMMETQGRGVGWENRIIYEESRTDNGKVEEVPRRIRLGLGLGYEERTKVEIHRDLLKRMHTQKAYR